MIIIFCLMILAYSILDKPIEKFSTKIEMTNWERYACQVWDWLSFQYERLGRKLTKYILLLWFIMKDSSTSLLDKALILGAIIYVLSPIDLLPRRELKVLGLLDDLAILIYVYKKVEHLVTPKMQSEVNAKLELWFGNGIVDQ